MYIQHKHIHSAHTDKVDVAMHAQPVHKSLDMATPRKLTFLLLQPLLWLLVMSILMLLFLHILYSVRKNSDAKTHSASINGQFQCERTKFAY